MEAINQNEINELRDALDHIARTCRKSNSQSRRILWIEARATGALYGNDQWKEINLPKNGEQIRRRLKYEIEQVNQQRDKLLEAARMARLFVLGEALPTKTDLLAALKCAIDKATGT